MSTPPQAPPKRRPLWIISIATGLFAWLESEWIAAALIATFWMSAHSGALAWLEVLAWILWGAIPFIFGSVAVITGVLAIRRTRQWIALLGILTGSWAVYMSIFEFLQLPGICRLAGLPRGHAARLGVPQDGGDLLDSRVGAPVPQRGELGRVDQRSQQWLVGSLLTD